MPPAAGHLLRLGDRRYDLTGRVLVVGVLDPAPESPGAPGGVDTIDAVLRRGEALVAEGADVLDVGGTEGRLPAVEALIARLDVPVAVETSDARVLAAAGDAGAVLARDLSGFADPGYLPAAARAGITVVVTHPPGAGPGDGAGLLAAVAAFLSDGGVQAQAAGVAGDRIAVDPGLGLGMSPARSALLLRESDRLARLGYPLMLSDAAFAGGLVGRDPGGRRSAALAAVAYGVAHGCRMVRARDVAGTVRVVRMIEQILAAGERR